MTLKAIDISSNNKYLNLKKFTGDIVINKLTGGDNYYWKENRTKDCLNAGFLTGDYHFAHEYGKITDYKTQANHFYNKFKPYLYKALPILDYEIALNGKNFNSNDIEFITNFMKYFKKLSGVNCVLYTSKDVIKQNYITDYLKQNNMLWFAQYANNQPTGYQSNPWTDNFKLDMNVIGQQYSANGYINGIEGPVDLSIFYITKNNWLKACKKA